MSEFEQDRTGRLKQTGETARTEATATADQARQAAGQVAETVAEQGRAVVGEARQQAGKAFDELRGRAVDEAEEQARRAAGLVRRWSDDIGALADDARGDSPARSLASQVSDRGHRAADYLEKQGVDGVLHDLRHFARRRPGAFLGGALLAGVVAGRLARAAGGATQSSQPEQRRLTGAAPLDTQNEPVLDTRHEPARPLPPGPAPAAPPVPPVSPPAPSAVPQPSEPSGTPQAPPPPMDPPPAGPPTRQYPEV